MEPKAQKQTQLILFGSFVSLVLVLTVVALFMVPARITRPDEFGFWAYGIAAIAAIACAYWVSQKLRFVGQIGEQPLLPDASKFQTNLLIALSLGEIPTLMGFVAKIAFGMQMVGFTLLTLILYVGLILPRLLEYWRLREQQG